MADPHGLSPGPTRYFTPSSRNQFQELDELYNRLTKIADDEFISEESQLNEECHAQQVAFLRRTDLPEDVGEKLRELLVENRDLRIDKLRWVYDAKKATIMKQKKLEEREMFAKMGPGNCKSNPVTLDTPAASPAISEGSPSPSPRLEERPSPTSVSTSMSSSIQDGGPSKNAIHPLTSMGYKSSPLNPATGNTPSMMLNHVRTPLSKQPENLPRPSVARNISASIGSAARPTQKTISISPSPQPSMKDHLQAQRASQRAIQAQAQARAEAKSVTELSETGSRDTTPQNTAPILETQADPLPKPVPAPPSAQKLTLTSFTKKRKPDGGRDDVLLPGPEFISERTKRPRKSDMGRSAPLIVIPQSRVINFEDVHQGGNPQFMHTIIKWEDGRFYILYCEEHGVHFRQRALTGAAKHLDSYAHGHMARFHHLALEKLGYLISDCDEEKQARHNTIVTQSFEQGYIIPSSESLLKPDNAWPAAQNNQPLQSPVVIDTDASTPAPAPEPVPLVAEQSQPAASNPTVEGVRKGPLHTKSGKRKSLSHKKTEVITNPVAGGLYYATPKAKLGDRPKKYIVMILAWKDLSHCGLPGRTLGQLELIKQAKRKECYLYDAEGISGWSPDYEDDGKQVKKRWFPVIWFEGNRTEDNREGWVRAEELSNFDLLPAPKRGAYHPETRAREWYYRSHPEQAHIFWDRIKASRTIEKSSELKSGVDAASAVVVEDDDPDGADADDADSDGEPAGEEATGRHDLTPVVDHPSDSDYHASDDRDMAESVTSSQHSPPSHPPPSHPPAKKKTIQEVRSKAAEVVIERPVTPIRVGAAAGTRSSTKKQSGGRDVEMTDAPPVAHDELSPLSRRAKGGFADDVNPGQVANVTPQGPAKMSVQLGTPLDNITSKVDVAQTALQEPERPDGSEQVTQQQMAKVAEMAAYLAQATQEHQAHQQQNDNEALESPATPKTVDSELLEVVDQARRRVTDQVYQNIVKEAIQGLLSQENASPGTADQASDKAQANHGTKDDVEASNEETHQPLQDANDDNEAVSSTVKHGGDLISMAMSIPPSPVTYQATAASSPSEAIDGKVADEAQEKTEETTQKKKKASVSLEGPETPASLIGESMAGSLTEDAAPSEKPTNGASTNGNLNSNSTNGDNVNGECAAQAADQVEPVVASTSPHTVDPIDRWRAVRTSHSPAVTPAVVKTSATEGEPTATKTTSAPISPAQAPATIKGSSALPAGSGSVPGSRLSTPMAQTPPVQSPRMQSPAVKRDTEAAGVVWQVSGIQQGNRRWSDATHTLRLVVDEAGVAKTSESDEMDATVNPQAIQSVHYSQSGDKSRAEVILMPRTGTVEQKLTFTVGAGRSKMQSFKFVRWLRQANPDITLVDGPKLRI